MPLSSTFLEPFSGLKDPRRLGHNHLHQLTDILAIAILATICGADNWIEMEEFAVSKEEWLRTFLQLPNGIPSHDTFLRVFAGLDADGFARCFIKWVKTIRLPGRDVITIDGKTISNPHLIEDIFDLCNSTVFNVSVCK